MRVQIGEEIDITKDIDASELAPLSRIMVAIRFKMSNFGPIVNSRKAKADREHRQRQIVINDFKKILNFKINRELIKNATANGMGENTEVVYFTVARSYEDIINIIIDSEDFISFDMKIIPHHPDMLKVFPQLPVMVKIERRLIR